MLRAGARHRRGADRRGRPVAGSRLSQTVRAPDRRRGDCSDPVDLQGSRRAVRPPARRRAATSSGCWRWAFRGSWRHPNDRSKRSSWAARPPGGREPAGAVRPRRAVCRDVARALDVRRCPGVVRQVDLLGSAGTVIYSTTDEDNVEEAIDRANGVFRLHWPGLRVEGLQSRSTRGPRATAGGARLRRRRNRGRAGARGGVRSATGAGHTVKRIDAPGRARRSGLASRARSTAAIRTTCSSTWPPS